MSFRVSYGDHPRECGEKETFAKIWARKIGSPPRVRGKEITFRFNSKQLRITPASAGKRISSIIVLCNDKNHPRECGEKAYLQT